MEEIRFDTLLRKLEDLNIPNLPPGGGLESK